jgi:[acyl-carrier-protein] S-malonyltransferase
LRKIAVIFPGQGAQYVGMGKDLGERYPAAMAVFDEADVVIGGDLLRIIFDGPASELQKTEYTQPAILAVSTAVYRVLQESGLRPGAFAGLSLGEYSALVAAGSLSFAEALPLVQKRGRYMQEAVPLGQGSMAAIMGLDPANIARACCEASGLGVVSPANYNCPGQVVISGNSAAVRRAAQLAKQAGARKVVELKVSAPFHCALLAPVETRLERELVKVDLRPPAVPVVLNVSAKMHSEPPEILASLVKQVSSPILWEQSMRTLLDNGFDTFIEAGPGKVLTKFMKQIDDTVYAAGVEDCATLEAVLGELKGVLA